MVDMGATPLPNLELSEDEWVLEVTKLATKSPDKPVFVRVQWSFGDLYATGFQPQVNGRMLLIPLQRQSPSGLADALITVCLPIQRERGEYRRYQSDSGDIVLTMRYGIGPPDAIFEFSEVHLATNPDFLNLVDSAAQQQ